MKNEIEIKGTISDFLEERGISIRLGIIQLGWENGWTNSIYDVQKALMNYLVEGTYHTSGSASSRRTVFDVNKDGEKYNVVYWTDSGD